MFNQSFLYLLVKYSCSYVAKLNRKKDFFFWKDVCVFYKIYIIYIICRKRCFYLEKKFYNERNTFLKKTLFTSKNISENVNNIYLISEIYYYTENVCVTNKFKSFLYIYIHSAKKIFLLKLRCELNNWCLIIRKQPICGIP